MEIGNTLDAATAAMLEVETTYGDALQRSHRAAAVRMLFREIRTASLRYVEDGKGLSEEPEGISDLELESLLGGEVWRAVEAQAREDLESEIRDEVREEIEEEIRDEIREETIDAAHEAIDNLR